MMPESSPFSFFLSLWSFSWPRFLDWWWLFLIPLCYWLGKIVSDVWLYSLWENWASSVKKTMLEIKVPKEVLEPVKAMETVFTGFWQIYRTPNWYERWWQGKGLLDFDLEIVGVDGVPHFYMRIPADFRNLFETHIYSQYPDVEISEVPDYTKLFPQDVPNNEWDLWGTDYKMTKPGAYPIRTFMEFETGKEEEEKRIDPISSLLEGLGRLKQGERVWIQITASPILDEDPWVEEGKEIRDKLARRQEKPAGRPMIQDATDILIFGKPPAVAEEIKEFLPPEMKLTPGEKDIITAVEKKISKLGFRCNAGYIYFGRKDVFFKANARLPMSYFTNFVARNLNEMIPDSRTITKIKREWYNWFWFVGRRTYLRQRQLFRNYLHRFPPFFPSHKGQFILNTEELASIYHFPGKMVALAPTMERVEIKKATPPPTLPMEEPSPRPAVERLEDV